ncbi:MAG: FeoA domain-containing protein [Wenzhouxiangellaceae bacterium]|nr:FeoA domain-containing protein [Wenzhouxiangellaceae bacterium]
MRLRPPVQKSAAGSAPVSRLATLDKVPAATRVRVTAIAGERRLRLRLLGMGLPVGALVDVLENRRGSVVVGIGGLRLGLGRELGRKLIVVRP